MKKYDYVIVGGGLFAGTFAYFARKQGKKCLVVEKRETLGGNIYCEDVEGMCINMGRTSSIQVTAKCGIL